MWGGGCSGGTIALILEFLKTIASKAPEIEFHSFKISVVIAPAGVSIKL